MNNLKYFRELADVTPKQLSKLLNVTVHTYIGFEQEKNTIPAEILLMLGKVYSIDPTEISIPQNELNTKTKTVISGYSTLTEDKKIEVFCYNLTGKRKNNLTFCDIKRIKQEITKELMDSDATDE